MQHKYEIHISGILVMPSPSDYLRILECDVHSTQEDIKASFRRLAKAHHPDTTGSSDATMFRLVNEAYTFLKDRHRPHPKPKETKGLVKFFRLIDKAYDGELVVKLPVQTLEDNAVLICMWRDKEFNVHLDGGTTLPKVIEIKNILIHPVRMRIEPGDDF